MNGPDTPFPPLPRRGGEGRGEGGHAFFSFLTISKQIGSVRALATPCSNLLGSLDNPYKGCHSQVILVRISTVFSFPWCAGLTIR